MGEEPVRSGGTAELALRPLAPTDVGMLARWRSDPRVLEFYGGRDRPMDERAVRDRFFGPGPVLPAEEFQAFLVERNGRPVGFVQVYRLPPEERELFGDSPDRPAYGVDLFLGEPELWGHGLGPRAIVLAREFLRDHRGAVRVVADPRVNNPRSVRAFEKAGFRKIRVLPARELHEGVRCDCWWMEYP